MNQTRLVLAVAAIASIVAFLDGSVVNVALPAITSHLGGGVTTQQWVIDAYMLTLGAFMLAAGSLSDIFGRKKIMALGLVWFGISSLLCAIAPSSEFLIVARALQGVGGALLVPSSLALIMICVPIGRRAHVIGQWTAWTGIAQLAGPIIGGVMVDYASWRYIFAINIVLIIPALWLLHRLYVPQPADSSQRLDYGGALLGAAGLGGTVFALIEGSRLGWSQPLIYLSFAGGVIALGLFVWYERRTKQPMMPPSLFRVRNFTVGNIATVGIYAALAVASFAISIFVQQVGGYSATAAGLTMLPVTIIMILLASRFGALAGRFGPRLFMTAGPIIAGLGFLTMLGVGTDASYWTLLPGILLFGFGLAMTVAPLTSAVLAAIDNSRAGIASAINNAISRVAGLIAIAIIGTMVGSSLGLAGFHNIMLFGAILIIGGGVVSGFGIVNPPVKPSTE